MMSQHGVVHHSAAELMNYSYIHVRECAKNISENLHYHIDRYIFIRGTTACGQTHTIRTSLFSTFPLFSQKCFIWKETFLKTLISECQSCALS